MNGSSGASSRSITSHPNNLLSPRGTTSYQHARCRGAVLSPVLNTLASPRRATHWRNDKQAAPEELGEPGFPSQVRGNHFPSRARSAQKATDELLQRVCLSAGLFVSFCVPQPRAKVFEPEGKYVKVPYVTGWENVP